MQTYPFLTSCSRAHALLLALSAVSLAACSLNAQGTEWGGSATGAGGAGPSSSSTGASGECAVGETRSCYSGRMGTEMVGRCAPGTQTCEGGAWGACAGETVPGVEDCSTNVDEDCDGSETAGLDDGCGCLPGTNAPCEVDDQKGACKTGMGVCDMKGEAVVACMQTVQPSFDNCVSAADEDCDGQAPACEGTPVFAVSASSFSLDQGLSVATDSEGNVIVGGRLDEAFWLAKFSATGQELWKKNLPATGFMFESYAIVRGVAVDPANDDVIVAGELRGQVNLGGTTLNTGSNREILLARFTKTGDHVFSKTFGDAGTASDENHIANAVALDADGNIYLTGEVTGFTSFGNNISFTAGDVDVFAAKLDNSGVAVWAKWGGDGFSQWGDSIAVSGTSVVIAGGFRGTLVDLTSTGGSVAFLIGLKTVDGESLFGKAIGDVAGKTAADQEGTSVSFDHEGKIVLAGLYRMSANVEGTLLTNEDDTGEYSDAFVAKYNPDSSLVWVKSFGDAATQQARGVAVDGAGNIVLTGHFSGKFGFGGDLLENPNPSKEIYDIFVAKLDPTGAHLWSAKYGDAASQRGWAVAASNKGNVFVTGWFQGSITPGAPADTLTSTNMGGDDAFLLGLAP